MLNQLVYCPKHERALSVGGAHGGRMFCPVCRDEAEPALKSTVPIKRATKRIFTAIARSLQQDQDLVLQVENAMVRWCADLQRPDPQELDRLKRQKLDLTKRIDFVLSAPGDTEEDMRENQQRLKNLRQERAAASDQIDRLQEMMGKDVRVPSKDEIRAAIDNMAATLTKAASSNDPVVLAAARRILEMVTGGKMVVSQQGEPERRRGWLRVRVKLHLLQPILEQFDAHDESVDGPTIEIDLNRIPPSEELADPAKKLWDEGVLVKKIAAELSKQHGTKIGRNLVTAALKHWFESRGMAMPDGRSRRSTLSEQTLIPPEYRQKMERTMELYHAKWLMGDIATEVGMCRDMITKIVKVWHEERGLPVPDGRTRRKAL